MCIYSNFLTLGVEGHARMGQPWTPSPATLIPRKRIRGWEVQAKVRVGKQMKHLLNIEMSKWQENRACTRDINEMLQSKTENFQIFSRPRPLILSLRPRPRCWTPIWDTSRPYIQADWCFEDTPKLASYFTHLFFNLNKHHKSSLNNIISSLLYQEFTYCSFQQSYRLLSVLHWSKALKPSCDGF